MYTTHNSPIRSAQSKHAFYRPIKLKPIGSYNKRSCQLNVLLDRILERPPPKHSSVNCNFRPPPPPPTLYSLFNGTTEPLLHIFICIYLTLSSNAAIKAEPFYVWGEPFVFARSEKDGLRRVFILRRLPLRNDMFMMMCLFLGCNVLPRKVTISNENRRVMG